MALQVTPMNSESPSRERSPETTASRTDSSNSVQILEPEEAGQGVKRKRSSSGGDGASSSRRKRHLITSEPMEENASSTEAEKEVPNYPPPM